jgi:hypothetical protein
VVEGSLKTPLHPNYMTTLTILTLILVSFAGMIPNQISPVWYPQLIMLSICVFLYVNLTLWKFNKWLSLFLGYCLFSVVFSDLFFALYNLNLPTLRLKLGYGLLSFGKINPRSLLILYHLYLCSYAAYLISFLKEKQRKYIVRTIAGIIGINILWSFLQYFNIDPIFHCINNIKVDNIVGFMGSWNCFGAYLAIGAPLVMSISPFLIFPLLLSVILAKMWYGVLVVSAITLLYLWKLKRRYLVYFVPVVLVASIFTVAKYDKVNWNVLNGDRVALWNVSTRSILKGNIQLGERNIKCSPWIGYGLGSFPLLIPNYSSQKFNPSNSKYNHAHNDPIEVLFDLGILGFIFLGLLLLSVWRRFVISVDSVELSVLGLCLLSYFLCSLSYFASHMPATGMLLVVIYGLFEAVRRENGAFTVGS